MKCVPRLTCPGPQIRRPRVHPGPRGRRAERSAAVRLSLSRQRGRRGGPGCSTAPWSGGPAAPPGPGEPCRSAALGSGTAGPGQDRSTPVPPHPHPPLGPGTAAPLQCSPLRPGGPHTVATLCRVGEGLSAADLLKIRPLAKWNLKCVVFVSLLT